jgi:uroporphyrinogen-III synthase
VRVLVTRALSDAPALVHALAEAGYSPVVAPLLELRFRIDDLARLAADEPRADVVIVTSAAGADAIAIAAPSAWRGARWAAVGPATAQRLREHGLPVHAVPARATALDLVAELGDVSGLVVVMPRGDLAPAEPVERLRREGATVRDVVCYENGEPPDAARDLLAALPVDATTLFSGSAAERLAAAVPPERRAELGRVVVVGPTTAEACARLGIPVAVVASPHTVDGVLAALGPRPR